MIVLCVYKEIMIITTFDVERPTSRRNEFKADDTRNETNSSVLQFFSKFSYNFYNIS